MEMKDFKIDIVNHAGLADLIRLEESCFSGDRITEKEYRRYLSRVNCRVYGLSYQGTLIASAVIMFYKSRSRARLFSFCLHQSFRGLGIANAMLKSIEELCANMEFKTMMLEVSVNNPQAFRLYTSRGFKILNTIYGFYEDGSDALRMEKVLDKPFSLPKKKAESQWGRVVSDQDLLSVH